MSIFNYPHIFQDGVGETASGAQVDENFEAVRAYLEEHQRHFYATPGGLEGNLVTGSKQNVPAVAAGTKVSFRAMMTETWNPSTEGGYTIELWRDGVNVHQESLSVSANRATQGWWVGQIELDYIQATAGAHTWEVKIFPFGTEANCVVHEGMLSVEPT